MCDDKRYLTLNTAELLPNICDNHHLLIIFTDIWLVVENIWQPPAYKAGGATPQGSVVVFESPVKCLVSPNKCDNEQGFAKYV
jgi:hypothetical protein